jgi:hypothetical protein
MAYLANIPFPPKNITLYSICLVHVLLHAEVFMGFENLFSMFSHHLLFFNGVEENNKEMKCK